MSNNYLGNIVYVNVYPALQPCISDSINTIFTKLHYQILVVLLFQNRKKEVSTAVVAQLCSFINGGKCNVHDTNVSNAVRVVIFEYTCSNYALRLFKL